MRKISIVLVVAFATACSSAKHTSSNTPSASITAPVEGADGSSFEKAIVIQETGESAGVSAEYKWLKSNYPGYKMGMQSLTNHNKKPYDVLTITTADGTEKKVYFDISNFYGKF